MNVTIDRVEGRKLFVSGRLHSLDKTVLYASADALFIKPKLDSAVVAWEGLPGR